MEYLPDLRAAADTDRRGRGTCLESTEHPAKGRWLYFVSIDTDGTTLFANTYEEHKRNRQKACDTGLLSTGC